MNGDAKLPLLKRYKDLDDAGSLLQRLKGFPDNRAEHAASISALHGVAKNDLRFSATAGG